MLLVNIAVQIEAVTIGWQVYTIGRATRRIKESAFLVGMVGLAQFLPLFALTLWAGSLADRHSRRAIVLGSAGGRDAGRAGAGGGGAGDLRPALHHIFAIAAIFGAARAFLSPAASALTPMLVPKADMPQAISLQVAELAGGGDRRAVAGRHAGARFRRRSPMRTAAVLYGAGCGDPAADAHQHHARTPAGQPVATDQGRAGLYLAATRSSSARSRWICSRCFWAGPRRCCRPLPATS